MSRREFKMNKVLCRKIGQKIRNLRLEKGLSQEALALEINVSGSFLGAIERAETDITLTMLHKISKALDTDWVEIIKVY